MNVFASFLLESDNRGSFILCQDQICNQKPSSPENSEFHFLFFLLFR